MDAQQFVQNDDFLKVVLALMQAVTAWPVDSVLLVELPAGIQRATIDLQAGEPAEVRIIRS